MDRTENTSPSGMDSRSGQPGSNSSPDVRYGREGGDDALEYSSPTDSRSDEKVIVNAQRAQKSVDKPSQTTANISEAHGNDKGILDGQF
jgi:hypothetical protein